MNPLSQHLVTSFPLCVHQPMCKPRVLAAVPSGLAVPALTPHLSTCPTRASVFPLCTHCAFCFWVAPVGALHSFPGEPSLTTMPKMTASSVFRLVPQPAESLLLRCPPHTIYFLTSDENVLISRKTERPGHTAHMQVQGPLTFCHLFH